MTPPLIGPDEIRPGDKVRGVKASDDHAATIEFTVDWIGDTVIASPRSGWTLGEYEWYLLDRPAPAIPVGALCRDRGTGDWYARTSDAIYPWVSLSIGGGHLHVDHDAATIARLEPVDVHGKGCSPWLWDPVTETAWVQGSGTYYTHIQVGGEPTRDGCLCAGHAADRKVIDRFVPYADRDQL